MKETKTVENFPLKSSLWKSLFSRERLQLKALTLPVADEKVEHDQQSSVLEDSELAVRQDGSISGALSQDTLFQTSSQGMLEPKVETSEAIISSSDILKAEPNHQSTMTKDSEIAIVQDVSDCPVPAQDASSPEEDSETVDPKGPKMTQPKAEMVPSLSSHSSDSSRAQPSDFSQESEDCGSVSTEVVQVNNVLIPDIASGEGNGSQNGHEVMRSNELSRSLPEGTNISHDGPEHLQVSSHIKQVDVHQGLVDTAAPFESVKEAVSKFGGIVDWKAHKIQTAERRKLVEQQLKKTNKEIPEYSRQSEAAEDSKAQVLKELNSMKILIGQLKLNLEKSQTEELQAKQDSELVRLRVEEMEQGIADEASVAAKAQLEVAKARYSAAVAELKLVKEELEALKGEYASLVSEKNKAVKSSEETVSASKKVEKTVKDLTLELIAAKESLESAHAAHLEAEEHRIGASMAREQDYFNWEKQLKEAEEELQKLNQQILYAQDLKSKLNTASTLLFSLKAELEVYQASKLNQEACVGEKDSQGELGDSMKVTHTDAELAVDLAKKKAEDVKLNIEKAKSEVECLRVAALSLNSEVETEKSALETIKQREAMVSIVIATLEADVNSIQAKLALFQMNEKEAGEEMVELLKQLQQAAEEADQAKSLAQSALEELQKAKEEAELAKASISTVQIRLHALQKEIEAARASDRLALAAVKALEESESKTTSDEDATTCVQLSLEDYYALSKKAHEAEEEAKVRVAAAVAQVEVARESEARSLEQLEKVNKEMASRKEALRIATEKDEKAKEGKLRMEQELRMWRAEHEQRRKAGDTGPGIVKSTRSSRGSSEDMREKKKFIEEPRATETMNNVTIQKALIPRNLVIDPTAAVKEEVKRKRTSLFPRIAMFLAKRRAQTSKS